MYNYFKIA